MGISLVIIAIVAIASFLGGLYIGSGSPSQLQVTTVTIQQRLTITSTFIQTIAPQAQTTQVQALQTITRIPEKILIGFTIPLTGVHAETGKRGFWGIMAAVKWVNEVYGGVNLYGRKIPLEVRYYDDASNKDQVQAFTERLITVDKVHFILSTHSSPLVTAQAPVTEKYKYILINWGAATDYIYEQGYKYNIQVVTPASKYQVQAVEALKAIDPGVKKVAFIYRDDELNKPSCLTAAARARELGFQVVYEKSYPLDIRDFIPYIVDLARSGAEALIACSYTEDGLTLAKQLADSGVNFKMISMNQAPCIQRFYDNLGKLAEGIICASQWEPGVRYSPQLARSMGIEWFGPTKEEFIDLFTRISGDPKLLSYHAAMAAAGVLVLLKAIETAQNLDQDAVRQAFNRLHMLTFFGVFKIDPATGKQAGHDMVLGQWQNGRFVAVWPQGAAETRLYYPLPTWDEKRAGKTASY